MTSPDRSATKPSPSRRRAVLYARVSSKEQEKEGFSIPAQLKLLRDYALREGLDVAREYVDIETAKQVGRTSFGEMVDYLEKHPAAGIVLVEKTDRLYRNLKDWVTVDELDIEIHFVKENVVLSRDARSAEKFMHGIKVLMAKNYIDNLAEEARKGMSEKAAQGIWPTKAPLGYRNVDGPAGKKIVVPDPDTAALIASVFEWYATGSRSLKDVTRKAQAAGLVYRRTGSPVPVSAIHKALRNPIYMGEFDWHGRRYQGTHEPLVSRELWARVQRVMDLRQAKKRRRSKHDFAFAGLIECGHCGCAVTGEIKKQRYVYYRCTGYKGECGEPYVREEVLEQQFGELLGQLSFDDEVLEWVRDALKTSHAEEQREHEQAIVRLQSEYERLQRRIHAMYVDKLDGRVDAEFHDRMAAEWRGEQSRCLREIERHQAADRTYLEEGIRLLELARNAQRLFLKQPPREQRRLLECVVSNSTWRDGRLTATLRQPFDLLAQTNALAARSAARRGSKRTNSESWLGD